MVLFDSNFFLFYDVLLNLFAIGSRDQFVICYIVNCIVDEGSGSYLFRLLEQVFFCFHNVHNNHVPYN